MLEFDPVIETEYSIYTKAYPNFANRLDFTNLGGEQTDLAYHILEDILQGKEVKKIFSGRLRIE